jgi:hypothetical protein
LGFDFLGIEIAIGIAIEIGFPASMRGIIRPVYPVQVLDLFGFDSDPDWDLESFPNKGIDGRNPAS